MLKYNRQQMLRLINHHGELATTYLQYTKEMSVDEALQMMYEEYIEYGDGEFDDLYQGLADKPKPLGEDSERVKKIYKVINEMGWKEFIIGLRQLADRQVFKLERFGSVERANQWKLISDKLRTIRKNAHI